MRERIWRLLCCRTGMKHVWRLEYTEDGGTYWRCARCGKDRYVSQPAWNIGGMSAF